MNQRRAIVVNTLLVVAAIIVAVTITNSTTPTNDTTPSTALPTPSMTEPPATPTKGHLIIPDAGLDTPLLPMHLDGSVINPPGTKAAYLLNNFGTTTDAPASGTLYIAMHALNHGRGPGNYISDTTTQTVTVHPGDTVFVDSLTYRITTTNVIHKPDLSSNTDLWNPTTPNRLILITCLPNPHGGTATDNIVIKAQRSIGA